MLIPNTLFRLGGAAILLTNKLSDQKRVKYELEHVVRVHLGADDAAYRCGAPLRLLLVPGPPSVGYRCHPFSAKGGKAMQEEAGKKGGVERERMRMKIKTTTTMVNSCSEHLKCQQLPNICLFT